MAHKFQIHLRGIIDLLSKHLYSGPQVFVRELLQNGVDAINARKAIEPGHVGEITLEILEPRGKPPTLVFTDNGVGLDESEIHEFLATIGQSSKRGDFERPVDFIGQFGVGLLSCFIVSDEIVVLSRSAKSLDAPSVEWRGRQDGVYEVRRLERELTPGTRVFLTSKPDTAEWFSVDRLRDLVRHFGELLPVSIRLLHGNRVEDLTEGNVPWRAKFANPAHAQRNLLEYGARVFGMKFLDAIPLRSEAGKIDGIAFVLPHAASLGHKRTHRVYLKQMLMSENAVGLLRDWAIFVKCVLNATDLRPVASREAFYDDESLAAARDSLGQCLRDYLVKLRTTDPEKLRTLIGIHVLAIKALACEDDDAFRLFIDFLPFETAQGHMTLPEYRKENLTLRYVPARDQFRQIATVAAAQGENLINGSYVYDADLIERFAELMPGASAEIVDAASYSRTFEELGDEERQACESLLDTAQAALRPFRCKPTVKAFRPAELPTMYSTSADGEFKRSLETTKERTDVLWSSILDQMGPADAKAAKSQLCLNYSNPLVRRLAGLRDQPLVRKAVEMLYVQALLLGRHPLTKEEMKLLNTGLVDLVERCIVTSKGVRDD